MSCIIYSLANTGALDTLASPGADQAGTLPQGLGTQAGLYVIVNAATTNRYIGKAGNLQKRFSGRMLAVNELGLSRDNLKGIGAFWGLVAAYNTPPLPTALPIEKLEAGITYNAVKNGKRLDDYLVSGQFTTGSEDDKLAVALQQNLTGTKASDPTYSATDPTVTLDTKTVDVEALLIRFFKKAAGTGGTVTNLQKTLNAFQNPTTNDMVVVVSWGACKAVDYGNGFMIITIPKGGSL